MKNFARNNQTKRPLCECELLLILILLFMSQATWAADLGDGWTSVRALGMGNAYSAVVQDGDSLFYNPAGLARVSGFHWTLMDPHVGLDGAEAIENVKKIKDAQGSANLSDAISGLYGKRTWVGGGGKTALVMPYFGFAGFANGEAGVYVQNPANTQLNLNYYFDYGVAVGAAVDFIPGIFKVGMTAKRINRTGTTLPIGAATIATLDSSQIESQLKSRGTGYGLDLGSVLTIPGPVSPAFSIVYKNLGYTAFTHDEGAGAPPRIPPVLVVGGALQVDIPLITITPAFDISFADRPDIQLGNKIHLGLEVALPLISLRGGINQGYYTAGVGLDLGLIRADVATYGVELGEYPGQQEDRRYVAQFTLELGFDPGKFGFGSSAAKNGSGGGRSRLKQRR
jgi:hypothetical protein